MNHKKVEELHWLGRFQERFAECPRSMPIVSESPDFLFPDRDLGIEVVEFIRGQSKSGSPSREREAIRTKIIREAQESFEAEHGQGLMVWVFWRISECPNGSEQKRLSQEIHRLIASRVAEEGNLWEINSEHLDTPFSQTHLAGINILKLNAVQKGCWKWPEGGFVGKNIDAIQMLLNDKNVKVKEYRKACKTIWLLIIASTGRVSTKLHPEDRLSNARFQTMFDRVFVYDAFNEIVEELQIQR